MYSLKQLMPYFRALGLLAFRSMEYAEPVLSVYMYSYALDSADIAAAAEVRLMLLLLIAMMTGGWG